MTERTIFLQALEQATPAERATFVEQACGDNTALRQRIEALLRSHEQGGSFLVKPAPQAVAEGMATPNGTDETQAPESGAPVDIESLDFLAPSERPGALGRLSHYDVLQVVGAGGMGIVLKAFDQILQRVVAIKVLAPALGANATARKRFSREVRAAAAITHDHVVTIHGVDEEHRPPFLVMQFVDGVSLQERLREGGGLAADEVVRVGAQIASGLAAAHALGFIHRDIKPANILLENGSRRAKLTDFGLARAADGVGITQSGVAAGTPAYMSPEQAEGKAVDHRSDLFSLGSVLYAMCTGHSPFLANSSMAVLKRVCEDMPTPIRQINPEIPDWLAQVVDKLHAKNPADRFQTAAEVANALERRGASNPSPPLPQPTASGETTWVDAPRTEGVRSRDGNRRRWGLTAAILAAPVAALALTELMGVTRLRMTVANLFRDERPPVVDHNVNPPANVNAAQGAFVLCTDDKERRFDTLAEAIAMAGDNAVIEIRGNGPFVSDGINIEGTSLVIRAAEGVRPVLQLSADSEAHTFLQTNSRLVLEGLELRRAKPAPWPPSQPQPRLVLASQTALYLANCRFVVQGDGGSVAAADAPACHVRNCEFMGGRKSYGHISWRSPPAGRFVLDNCVLAGDAGLAFWFENSDLRDVTIRLVHNTLCVGTAFQFSLNRDPGRLPGRGEPRAFSVEAAANVVDARKGVFLFEQAAGLFVPDRQVLQPDEAERLLPRLLAWHDQHNLYPEAPSFLNLAVKSAPLLPSRVRRSLIDWHELWGSPDARSVQARIQYEAGDPSPRAIKSPESSRASGFRLHPAGAGYRAGQDGRDLGAAVDRVGPGAAYDHWKKTPDYQEWLKVTGQVK